MLDAVTGKPIQVIVYSEDISYIDLPASQLDAVSNLFTEKDIPHWKNHLIISFDGRPPVGSIQLSRKADPRRAQEVLDAVP